MSESIVQRLTLLIVLLVLFAACGANPTAVREAATSITAARSTPVPTAQAPVASTPASTPSNQVAPLPATASVEPDIPTIMIPSGNEEIYVMPADGTNEWRLTDHPALDISPAWSPDGSMIAFVSDRGGQSNGLYLIDADGSNLRHLADNVEPGRPSWSPDGSRIAFTTPHGFQDDYPEIYVVDLDSSKLTKVSGFERVPTDSLYMGSRSPSWSPDGERLAFVTDRLDGPSEIYVMAVDGSSRAQRLTDSPEREADPAWSPDGQQIAFWTNGPDGAEIYVMEADGSNRRNLSNHPAGDLLPAWSPDGQQIAFVSDRDGNSDIYVMAADGTGVRRLTDHSVMEHAPVWSPDGRQIAFVSRRDSRPAEPCSFAVSGSLVRIQSVEALAWMSHQIVVGTVVEALPPAWGEPLNPEHDPCLTIHSDYVVQTEQRLRGQPSEMVRVRLSGGTIGPYTQTFDPQPELALGDRLLLFLGEARSSTVLPPAYRVVGGPQGHWTINPDDTSRPATIQNSTASHWTRLRSRCERPFMGSHRLMSSGRCRWRRHRSSRRIPREDESGHSSISPDPPRTVRCRLVRPG